MQGRSLTARNLAGGFLGGVLGILAFADFGPVALAAACFTGVFIGFHAEEVAAAFHQGWRRSSAAWGALWRSSVAALGVPVPIPPWLSLRRAEQALVGAATWLARAAVHLVDVRCSPLVRWVRAHPMNRAALVTAAAYVTFVAMNALWYVPLVRHATAIMDRDNHSPDALAGLTAMGMLLATAAVGMCLLLPIAIVDREGESLQDMARYYRRFQRYVDGGVARYFLSEFRLIASGSFVVSLSMLGAALYFIGVGTLVLAVVVLPVAAFVLSLRGIARVVQRGQYWLCLTVTLAATSLVAWQTAPYLEDLRLRSLVALTTGALCAAASELARRAIAEAIERSPALARISTAELSDLLRPVGQRFLATANWMGNNLRDPMFNALVPAS